MHCPGHVHLHGSCMRISITHIASYTGTADSRGFPAVRGQPCMHGIARDNKLLSQCHKNQTVRIAAMHATIELFYIYSYVSIITSYSYIS